MKQYWMFLFSMVVVVAPGHVLTCWLANAGPVPGEVSGARRLAQPPTYAGNVRDLVLAFRAPQEAPQREQLPYRRTRDIIYGRDHGMALTMDVFEPTGKKTGAGVIFIASGGWFSRPEFIRPEGALPFLKRGYVVFAVVHGSQPKFTIPEILRHVRRAVRFIRHEAARFGVDPERLGVSGGSAGGHLSLMLGLAPAQTDQNAKDPVDQLPAKVSAVACFFPPTDFLNWGKPSQSILQMPALKFVYAAFDFHRLDQQTGRFERITDPAEVEQQLKEVSPIQHVSPDDPPVLLIHGDADTLVPLQQSQDLERKLRAAGVPVKLVIKPGAGHGWQGMDKDLEMLADWFDQHLLVRNKKTAP
jgi:acetyl esterase/lipase